MSKPEDHLEELEVGLLPRHISVALDQIQFPIIETRKIGFNTLINAKPGQDGYEELFENDVFSLLIESFNDSNLPIIGMVCAAYRNLSFLNPEKADEYTNSIPIPFLLTIKENSEVIDFMSTLVLNSFEGENSFPNHLLSNDLFLPTLEEWLHSKNNAIVKSSLDLINSFAMYNSNSLDFSIVADFIHPEFSAGIRALALNILIQIEPKTEYYTQLISILEQDEKLGQTYFEIIHDIYSSNPEIFPHDLLFQRCLEHFNVNAAALLVANMSNQLNEEQMHLVVDAFFQTQFPTAEQCFALSQLLSVNSSLLNPDQYEKIGELYTKEYDIETMGIIENIISTNLDYATSEDAQMKYLFIINKGQEHALRTIEFILELFSDKQMIQPLSEALSHYVESNKGLVTDLQEKIDILLSTS